MDLDLGGKIAIVTGGAMGIGKGIVECLVREGAKVVIADLNDKEAEKVAKKLGENVIAMRMDVTNKAEVENVVVAGRGQGDELQLGVGTEVGAGLGHEQPVRDEGVYVWKERQGAREPVHERHRAGLPAAQAKATAPQALPAEQGA